MELIKKLAVVLLTVVVSTVLARLVLDWLYHHDQSLFSFRNILFGLSGPLAFVLVERKQTIAKLARITAGFAIAFTVIDFILVHYDLGWPGSIW